MSAWIVTTAWTLALLTVSLGEARQHFREAEANESSTGYRADTQVPTSNTWGFIIPLGPHHLQSRSIIVPINVIKPHYIKKLLEDIDYALQAMAPSHNREPRWQTLNHVQERLEMAYKEMEFQEKLSRRHRRSWFDLGGKGLKIALGVATMRDIEIVRSSLQKGTERLDILDQAIDVRFNQLQASALELGDTLSALVNATRYEVARIQGTEQLSRRYNLISDLITSVETELSYYLQVHHILLSTQLHSPTRDQMIEKALALARKVIPHGEHLAISPLSSTWTQAKRLITIEETRQFSTFAVRIPVVHTAEFHVYEVSPTPVRTKGSWMLPVPCRRYLAKSNEGFFETERLDCNRWYCPQTKEDLILHHNPTCTADIVAGTPQLPRCQWTPTPRSDVWLTDLGTFWIIHLMAPSPVRISCGRNVTNYHAISGSLIISQACSLVSRAISLRGREPTLTLATNSLPDPIYTPLNITINETLPSHANWSHILRKINNLTGKMSSLNNSTRKLDQRRVRTTVVQITLGTSVGVSLGIAGIVAVYVIVVEKKRKSKKRDLEMASRNAETLHGHGTL